MTLKNIYGSSVEVIGKTSVTMKNGKEKWMFVVTGYTAKGEKPVKYETPENISVSDFSGYKKYLEILPII